MRSTRNLIILFSAFVVILGTSIFSGCSIDRLGESNYGGEESENDGGGSSVVSVTGVTLNKASTSIRIGLSEQLTATIIPDSATNQNLIWSSSNETVASISSAGNVTALAQGNTIITVTTEDGDFQNTCDVTITTINKVVLTDITTGQDMISFTWIDPVDTYMDHVEISYTDGSTTGTESVDGGEQTCEISSLNAETAYTLTIRAADSIGNLSAPNTFTASTTSGDIIEFLKIYTANDLNAVRGGIAGYDDWDLDKQYLLLADIDLDGYDAGDGYGWLPIGNGIGQFTGTFNGNGYIISNLVINRSSSEYQGLFGYVGSGGRIENFGLENINITGGNYTGGLVGGNEGTVTDCYATGIVNGSDYTGGLLGGNAGIITNCHAIGDVTGSNYYTGGLLGGNAGIVTNCHAIGNVTGSNYYTGGLVGYNYYGTITDCYATGGVSGSNYYTGGLVGLNDVGAVTQCYSTGDVTGTDCTGGLVGFNDGTITNCYATGDVTGSDGIGGLLGANFPGGTVSDCYAIGEVTGSDDTGGLVGYNDETVEYSFFYQLPDNGIGIFSTESDMKTELIYTDAGWNFPGIWSIGSAINSGFPYLTALPPE